MHRIFHTKYFFSSQLTSPEQEIMGDKVSYLLQLLGHDINSLDFHDVDPPSIFDKLTLMVASTPLIEDTYESETTESQLSVEKSIKAIYKDILQSHKFHNRHFEAENHTEYIELNLRGPLPLYFYSLDPNHSWMLYWLTNAGHLIHHEFPQETIDLVVEKIKTLVVDGGKGGIAGGRNQYGHVASSYAAILTLVSFKQYDYLQEIKHNLHDWFMSLKQPNGSFVMHRNGEADNRSTYCVLVMCSLMNVLTPDISENVVQWIADTQTYEGGFAGVTQTEAHGGYTFCAVSSLFLLLGAGCKTQKQLVENIEKSVNLGGLCRWLVARQLSIEGGFNGRSNKLVDACYSFWIGACFSILEAALGTSLFDKEALKIYIMNCAQSEKGGFRDKPGKSVDFYHTNYTLLGLSVSEHNMVLVPEENSENSPDHFSYCFKASEVDDDTNTVEFNPVFGIPLHLASECKQHTNT